jgi:tetrahydromethanopterin S-methyltransferase subunit B
VIHFWSWVWGGIITGLVALDAILNAINPKYTLSARIWQLEGIDKTTGKEWTLFRYGMLVILVWLIMHLVFKIARGV